MKKKPPFKHTWVGELTCIGQLNYDTPSGDYQGGPTVKIEDQGAVLVLTLAPRKSGVYIREAKIPVPISLAMAIQAACPSLPIAKEIRLELTVFDRPIWPKKSKP